MSTGQGLAPIRGPEDFAEVLKVPRETIHRLERYAELLAQWQKSTNLVAPSTLPRIWSRHFADSAQIRDLAPEARLWLDLGQGQAFPGSSSPSSKPVSRTSACISSRATPRNARSSPRSRARPRRRWTSMPCALNSSAKALTALGLTWSARGRSRRLPRLFELASPFFGPSTRGLFLKGREAEAGDSRPPSMRWELHRRSAPEPDLGGVAYRRGRAGFGARDEAGAP